MSGLLTGLVERTLGLVPVLEPRPRSRFEPVAQDGFEVVVPEPAPVDGLPRAAGARPPDVDVAPVHTPRQERRAERPAPGRPEPTTPTREAPDTDVPAPTPAPVSDVTPRHKEQAAARTGHRPSPEESVRPSPPEQTSAQPAPPPRPDEERPATARQTVHRPSPKEPVRPSPPVRVSEDRDVPEEPPAAVSGRPRPRFAHGSAAAETAPRTEPATTSPVTASGVPLGEHGPLIAGRKDGGAAAPPPAGGMRPVSTPMSPPGEPAGPPPDPAVVRAALRQALPAPQASAGGARDPERATAAPRITVNIGRVELRTTGRPAPSDSGTTRPAGPAPRQDPADGARPLSLADYLAGRDQGSGS
ncbi:hypothetical protein ACFV2H_00955 [Streptomyces sp. NPDC059629]|uniref:hypothetical protein n=1 Tax=Streptomyces sp. NPDC059629 TaxID=3346889 RepID=UPI0036C45785